MVTKNVYMVVMLQLGFKSLIWQPITPHDPHHCSFLAQHYNYRIHEKYKQNLHEEGGKENRDKQASLPQSPSIELYQW